MKTYLGSYFGDGWRVQTYVQASTWDEAVVTIRRRHPETCARIDGEHVADIPVNEITLAPVGMLARLWCWVRNVIW